MKNSIVKRIVEHGWRGVNTGGKHSGLLNAMYTAGLRSWFEEKVADMLAGQVITHPNLADSSSRMRPLVLAGKVAEARAANEIFQKERVVAGGVTQHTTARSTHGWVFADTADMVPPSQAILGTWELALADLKGFHKILAQPDGLMRHVFNASVPPEESYVDIDLWIDGTAWGRANGWWMAGVVDTLEVIPQASWDRELVAMYEKTVSKLGPTTPVLVRRTRNNTCPMVAAASCQRCATYTRSTAVTSSGRAHASNALQRPASSGNGPAGANPWSRRKRARSGKSHRPRLARAQRKRRRHDPHDDRVSRGVRSRASRGKDGRVDRMRRPARRRGRIATRRSARRELSRIANDLRVTSVRHPSRASIQCQSC